MRLSKSKLVAYRQCPKRLWLQTYRRDLAQQSEAVENRMAQGNLVGAAAQRLYPEGRLIAHVYRSHVRAARDRPMPWRNPATSRCSSPRCAARTSWCAPTSSSATTAATG